MHIGQTFELAIWTCLPPGDRQATCRSAGMLEGGVRGRVRVLVAPFVASGATQAPLSASAAPPRAPAAPALIQYKDARRKCLGMEAAQLG